MARSPAVALYGVTRAPGTPGLTRCVILAVSPSIWLQKAGRRVTLCVLVRHHNLQDASKTPYPGRALSLTAAGVRFAFVPMMMHLIWWAIGVCEMRALICAKHLTRHLWLC